MSRTAPLPPPPLDVAHLPDDVATLQQMIVELLASLEASQRDRDALQHRLDLLLRRLYGPRGERFDPHQPLLFPELADGPDTRPAADPPPPDAPPKRRGKPHGRRRLPAHLPRQTRHHELTEAQRLCPGCGGRRVDIGVDTSEQLDYRPASLFVLEHIVHKYVCPCCRDRAAATVAVAPGPEGTPLATPLPPSNPEPEPAASAAATPAAMGAPAAVVVVAAAKPAAPITKGLPGPGLLAHLIVSKYVDHLPLYRLERVYERQGLCLPRSTLCDWLAACAVLLRPLYERLVVAVLQSRVVQTDDTPVKLQDPVTRQLSTARFWAYLGDAAHPYHVFDFTPTRQRDGPQRFLATYQGYLQADAFSGYDGLYLPTPGTGPARIVEVACHAHARRKFYEARTSAAAAAHQALAYYRQLYALERSARDLDLTEAQRLQMRQDFAVPILQQFHRWLQEQQRDALPKSPLGEAVGYALRNWTALVRYTEAGFLAIDNNAAEREMKRLALGRKNWLFVGSPQGGQTAAVLVSFASTCQRLKVEPWAYLQDVLTRLPTMAAERLEELLPDHWQAARAAATPATTPPPEAPPL